MQQRSDADERSQASALRVEIARTASVTLNLDGETRMTDPTTGGQKGVKLARFDLIPPDALQGLAEIYGFGATKYDDNNWRKGYKWGYSVGALQRHVHAWLQGERHDPESGKHHLLHAAWHCFTLFVFDTHGLGTDDRPLPARVQGCAEAAK